MAPRPCCGGARGFAGHRLAIRAAMPKPRHRSRRSFSRAALDRIGDYIRNEVATGKIPGAVLLIQQHGKPVYFESFGVRDIATKLPMTPDTLFRIYSMSKAVTSVAAMMLVDDGKLSLDDPVSKYIPAFADAKVGVDLSDEAGQYPLKLEPLKRPITIRDLLRHTSGITYGFYGESAVRKLYANPRSVRRRFRQRRIRRAHRETAARRSARNALGLRPFDRRARSRRRGGVRTDAISILEAKAVRSARDVRDRLLCRG